MKRARPWLLFTAAISAGVLAYLARDTVRDLVLLPLAYLLWQLRGLLAGVAQLVQWAVLVAGMALIMAWQLVPKIAARGRRAARGSARNGAVHATAVSLWRARTSKYFRWQVAQRLGKAASQLADRSGSRNEPPDRDASIAEYLDAGVNHSFVEYSVAHLPFAAPSASPLDLAPQEVVEYLESHLTQGGRPYGDSF